MIRYKVVQMDEGGEAALAFAKAKVRSELETVRIDDFTSTWIVGAYQVTARCMKIGDDHVVRIMVVGGNDGAILYRWPGSGLATTVGLRRFSISSADPTMLAASQRVNAVALEPLGTSLAFDNKIAAGELFISAPLATKSRVTRMLERCVRNEAWFSSQALSWFLARTTFMRNGTALRVVAADCLLSKWFAVGDDGGDFYVLLGSFPQSGEAPSTPALNRLVTQDFTGVIVPWSALKASLTAPTPTVFTADLDSTVKMGPEDDAPTVASLVRDVGPSRVTRYQRKDPWPGIVFVAGDPGVSFEGNIPLVSPSPFARAYDYTMADQSGGFFQTFTAHTLSSAGVIEQDDMTDGIEIGTSTGFLTASGHGNVFTSLDCDLTFFTGEEFQRYGSHHFHGGSGDRSASLNWDETAMVPFDEFQGYIHEYGLVLTGLQVGSAGTVTAHALGGPESFTKSHATTIDDVFATSISASYTGIETVLDSTESTSGDIHALDNNLSQTVFGMGPIVTFNRGFVGRPYPQGLALPPTDSTLYKIGGIFWPRDGGLGVLIFQLPTDTTTRSARADDVTKYMHVFAGDVGYRRIKNDDGSFTEEPNWEDPEAIVARIAASTTIVANNFATPALLPWLDEGLLGVILDQ